MLSLSDSLKFLLVKMKEIILAIPRIGCGTDGLVCSKIKPLIPESWINITIWVP
jgi:hypothetical protein